MKTLILKGDSFSVDIKQDYQKAKKFMKKDKFFKKNSKFFSKKKNFERSFISALFLNGI